MAFSPYFSPFKSLNFPQLCLFSKLLFMFFFYCCFFCWFPTKYGLYISTYALLDRTESDLMIFWQILILIQFYYLCSLIFCYFSPIFFTFSINFLYTSLFSLFNSSIFLLFCIKTYLEELSTSSKYQHVPFKVSFLSSIEFLLIQNIASTLLTNEYQTIFIAYFSSDCLSQSWILTVISDELVAKVGGLFISYLDPSPQASLASGLGKLKIQAFFLLGYKPPSLNFFFSDLTNNLLLPQLTFLREIQERKCIFFNLVVLFDFLMY